MTLLLKLKNEIKDCSVWFKAVLVVSVLVYLSLWFFTIGLSHIQKDSGIEPVLPGASKDSQGYIVLSESLINGDGLSQNGRVETLRGLAYPLFAAIIKTVGMSYFAVTLVQILFVLGSSLVIRRIGMLFSGRLIGEIAAAFFLLNPVTQTLSLLILTDTLFLFLFVSGFYLAMTIDEQKFMQKTILASIFFVLAIYVRGMGLFALPIFIVPILASHAPIKIQCKSTLIMLFLISISVTPWIIRNYMQTGVASWNSFESVNLSWIVPKFLASTDGTDEEKETLAFQKATGVPEEAWQNFDWHDIRYSKQINTVGERIILDRPFSYLKFHIITSMPFLFPSSIQFMREAYDSALEVDRPWKYGAINYLTSGDWQSFYEAIKEEWWKFAERILWLLGLMLGLYSVWANRHNKLAWVFVFIIAYLMLLSGPAAGPRLSFQAWPFMFILFVSGGSLLFQKFSRSNSKVA